jgi:hypothetical protein
MLMKRALNSSPATRYSSAACSAHSRAKCSTWRV